jgi:hypothetical protein
VDRPQSRHRLALTDRHMAPALGPCSGSRTARQTCRASVS